MELSKVVALTALFFIVVLILTAGPVPASDEADSQEVPVKTTKV